LLDSSSVDESIPEEKVNVKILKVEGVVKGKILMVVYDYSQISDGKL